MQLINELYQDVCVYLVGLTHNPTLSEDLLSEIFLGAIKSLRNFKGDSDIKTWYNRKLGTGDRFPCQEKAKIRNRKGKLLI